MPWDRETKLAKFRGYSAKYHQKMKDNPEYREKNRRYSAAYRDQLKNDPVYQERRRQQGRDNYRRNIQQKPGGRQKHRKRSQAAQERHRAKLLDVKKHLQSLLGGRCLRCGIDDHRLLDFDHIDPLTKVMNISAKLHLNIETLKKEIEKCQLLCANCHRLKTIEQHEHDAYVRRRDSISS